MQKSGSAIMTIEEMFPAVCVGLGLQGTLYGQHEGFPLLITFSSALCIHDFTKAFLIGQEVAKNYVGVGRYTTHRRRSLC